MKDISLEFSISSDSNFEELIADIGFEDKLVAILSQEEGFEKLRIRLYPPKDGDFWDFSYDQFSTILQKARKRLWELRKDTESNLNPPTDENLIQL
jgi:hypothetical protein